MISGANDFARQVIATVDSSRDAALKNALLHYIMAFPVALKVSFSFPEYRASSSVV